MRPTVFVDTDAPTNAPYRGKPTASLDTDAPTNASHRGRPTASLDTDAPTNASHRGRPTASLDTDAPTNASYRGRPTVFLDRDGTLHVDQVRGVDVAKLDLTPRAAEAVRAWRDAGWRIVVVSNQSGLARGLYTEAQMHAFHRALEARLGVVPDAWYWCPHLPDAGCDCRKPKPGMLLRAARDLDVDLPRAFFVGDACSDVEAGRAAGARTVLVAPRAPDACAPDHVAPDLLAAARWTLDAGRAHP